jgi:hypothetical protein
VPPEHQAGYGPRLTALVGELGGMHRCHPQKFICFACGPDLSLLVGGFSGLRTFA